MIKIRPEFDTHTNTWFWDEFEAPTLRELQKQVGRGVHLLDYYPLGLARTITIRRVENEVKRPKPMNFKLSKPEKEVMPIDGGRGTRPSAEVLRRTRTIETQSRKEVMPNQPSNGIPVRRDTQPPSPQPAAGADKPKREEVMPVDDTRAAIETTPQQVIPPLAGADRDRIASRPTRNRIEAAQLKDEVLKLLDEGRLNWSQIADHLGCTKNVVAGINHRRKWS